MKDLGVLGSLMPDKEIGRVLHRKHEKGLVYGPRETTNSLDLDLALGEDVRVRASWPKRKHPNVEFIDG